MYSLAARRQAFIQDYVSLQRNPRALNLILIQQFYIGKPLAKIK
jgi:hypothetical protein